jgi:uncharacterized SAM-binding protein YcdF (DUF218 family)
MAEPTSAAETAAQMFVALSKIAWFALQPVSLTLALLLCGLILGFTRFRRLAVSATALGALLLAACAFTSLGYVLIQPLEQRFSRPPSLPAEVAGIIVLGGGMDAEINDVRGGYELNRSGDRFTEALRLTRLRPDAKVVVTGGTGVFFTTEVSEAAAGARFFTDLGVSSDRLILEARARNTEENARFTRELVSPAVGETWLLVTSAYHMPRAIGLFRRAGFQVVPWPADYLSTGSEAFTLKIDQPAENLSVTTLAMREWIGLLAYALTGRIDVILPAP